jgi:hypothetical protein
MRRLLVLVVFAAVVRPAFGQGEAGREIARQALGEAVAASNRVEPWGDQSALRRRIAPLLARLDPRGAGELVSGIRRVSDRARAMIEVAAALPESEGAEARRLFVSAVARAREMTQSFHREQELRMIALEAASAGIDANEVMALVRSLPREEWLLGECVEGLARAGASELVKEAKQPGTSGEERERMLAAAIPELGRSDLDQAVALLEQVRTPRLRSRALAGLASAAPAEEAIGLSARTPDQWLRCNLLAAAAVRVSERNAELALEAVEAMPAWRDSLLASLAGALAAGDCGKGAEAEGRISVRRIRAAALCEVGIACFSRERESAEKLLGEAGVTAEAEAELGHRYERGLSLSPPLARDFALAEAAARAAEKDPGAAIGMATRIEDEFLRFRAVRAAALSLARQSLDKATSLLGLLGEAPRVTQVRTEAAGLASAESGISLLKSAPTSEGHARALLALAGRQSSTSLEGALETARLALPGEVGLRWLAPALAAENPEAAVKAAMRITSPKLRAYALVEIAESLLGASRVEEDEAAAREVWRTLE